jgi:hypothetical protein
MFQTTGPTCSFRQSGATHHSDDRSEDEVFGGVAVQNAQLEIPFDI